MIVGLAREHRNIVVRLNHGSGESLRIQAVSRMSSVLRKEGVTTLCVYWSFGRLLRWRGGAACAGVVGLG
jgi:hypothetical protein